MIITDASSSETPRSTSPEITGASLSGVRSRTAIAGVTTVPSSTPYENVTSVSAFTSGVSVQVPSILSTRTPEDAVTVVTERVSPSTSVALASKSASVNVKSVSSLEAPRSTFPEISAASFDPFIVTVTVRVDETP